LEGVVAAIGEGGIRELQTVVDDPNLGAIDKLHAYFRTDDALKAEKRHRWCPPMMRCVTTRTTPCCGRGCRRESMRSTAPMLQAIIRQGCGEGVFDTDYSREAALIITGMAMHLADAFIDAIEADGGVGSDAGGANIQGVLAAYFQAFEAHLGGTNGLTCVVG